MRAAIGIDLGLKFSSVGFCVEDGRVVVAKSDHGNDRTPSVVQCSNGRYIVGAEALQLLATAPTRTIVDVRHLMGRDVKDNLEPVLRQQDWNFQIAFARNGEASIKVGEDFYFPEEISAIIVKDLKRLASKYIEPPTDAVITVPTHFTARQREATRAAALRADLNVLQLISEPEAAAIAFSQGCAVNLKRKVLVYNFALSSFEISIVDVRGVETSIVESSTFVIEGLESYLVYGKMKMNTIDEIVLVGELTGMQGHTIETVKSVLAESYPGKPVRTDIEPALAITHGAAILAAALFNKREHRLAQLHEEIKGNIHGFTSKFTNEFKIGRVIGRGGFGTVFEATNVYDDCTYAVKRVAVVMSEQNLSKALIEVKAMAKLDNTGIVRYHSTWMETPTQGWQENVDDELAKCFPTFRAQMPGPHKSFVYIQMQLCNMPLDVWLKEIGQHSRHAPKMTAMFKQIVAAVAYIHEKGLIHRDLKPSNILFADNNVLKICDLGIASKFKLQDGIELSGTRTNIGTRLYMAPEQEIAFKYDSKVDVYSLGLILAEMSIIMNNDNEREEMFYAIRYRLPLNNLESTENQLMTRDFIYLLTEPDSKKRPTCAEMLKHEFLSSIP